MVIIKLILERYPTINIKNIYLISDYDLFNDNGNSINSRHVIEREVLKLFLNRHVNVYTLTFNEFNRLLLGNNSLKHERVLCFSINSQILIRNVNSNRLNNFREIEYKIIGEFYRRWLTEYEKTIFMIQSNNKSKIPLEISRSTIINQNTNR
jgi:hypothetical protein